MSRINLRLAATLVATGFLVLALTGPALAQQKGAADTAVSARAGAVRYEIDIMASPYVGQIRNVKADGTVEFEEIESEVERPLPATPVITEGYFLGLVQEVPSPTILGARILRVLVTEVLDDGKALLKIGGGAVQKVAAGETMMLFRPVRATTAHMKKLPDLAVLEQGEGAPDQGHGRALLNHSFNNLKQIGLALHNYHDTYGAFPPAVIVGPDGEPWHSWRVLILPFLDQAPLYNQYRFDEPWDGPNNSRLLEKMPAAYSDPIHGENEEHLTHYAAFSGEKYAFSADGVEMTGQHLSAGRRIARFVDGTSNTLLVGPAVPEENIPWMKPEDIVFEDEITAPGSDDSIALPYEIDGRHVAPILRCDGSVFGLPEGVPGAAFKSMLTIGGGEVVDWDSFGLVGAVPTQRMTPVIYVETTAKGGKASFVEEPVRPRGVAVPRDLPASRRR